MEGGYSFRPTGFLSRIRTFLILDRTEERDASLITRLIFPGAGMDGPRNSFGRFRLAWDRVRSGSETFPRRRFYYSFESPRCH